MMLFPLGGGNGHELSAHFYTHEVHNPAVVKGVMQDAFDYMKKYHDVKMTYSLPRIHVEPDFQTQIAHHVGGKKKKLHPSWHSFIHLVQRKKEKKTKGLRSYLEPFILQILVVPKTGGKKIK